MSAAPPVVQVTLLALCLAGALYMAHRLAREAVPGLAELLNRCGPVLVALGLWFRNKLTRRRK